MSTKVIHRKLGKEKADGLAYKEDKEIHIDERLKGKRYILTAMHELIHVYFPELSESKVDKISRGMTNDLWKLKIRRIDI
jgi:hypothetical protein